MKSFGLFLLLAASLVNNAFGKSNLYSGWTKKFDNEPYEDLTAQVGDSITFIWPTNEIANIFIHPTNDCTQTGRIPIGNNSPTEYIFKPEDAAPGGKQIFFANDVSDHCENYGMRLSVFVYPSDDDDDDGSDVNLTSDPTANPTNPPTLAPTPLPTALPTPLPSPKPSPNPTVAPTFSPTAKPTTKPGPSLTETPTEGNGVTEKTMRGLQMTLSGIDSFSDETKLEWSSEMEDHCTSFYEGDIVGSTFETSVSVTNFFVTSNSKRSMRGLQTNSVIVTYNQEVSYSNTGRARIDEEYLAKAPFETDARLSRFVTILQASNDAVLETVTGVSPVTFADELVPSSAPTPTSAPRPVIDGPKLSMAAIIGIACGAGALVIIALLFWFYCGSSKGKELEMGDEAPPPNVSIKPDDVSTLPAPEAGNVGEQSLEGTVDYDYSKAYQDKDHSVSYSGGTLGSKTEDFSFPVNAGATGAALGPYEETEFPQAKFKEEILHIFAPPGKLGVVIDTPDDGAPLVHAVKETSVVVDKVKVGDKLVAVDDEDVRTLTAIKVSKLISRKSANPSRKLTVLRRTQIA